MTPAINVLLLAALTFTGMAMGTCQKLSQVTLLGSNHNYHGHRAAVNFFGNWAGDQIQQVSVGQKCKEKNASPNNHQCQVPVSSGKPMCALTTSGNVLATATTNLTYISAGALTWIGKLAAKQVPWPNTNEWKYGTSLLGPVQEATRCLEVGQTGFITYTPFFECAAGILTDCGDEATRFENLGVTVCMPRISTHGNAEPEGFIGKRLVPGPGYLGVGNPADGLTGNSGNPRFVESPFLKVAAAAYLISMLLYSL